MGKFYSPLRYPGGKACLFDAVKKLLAENNLTGGTYAEPFAGGAGLALKLLLAGNVSEIHINDIDRSVYAFWHSVLNETDRFIETVLKTDITVAEHDRQFKIQQEKEKAALFELGFSTFFLNRTNVSGVLRGGIIGGRQQTGKYKIDARFNKEALTDRIRTIAGLRERIHVHNKDGAAFLSELEKNMPERSLVFLDPPYYEKGAYLYYNHFRHKDHAVLAEAVMNYSKPWIVSYDNVPEICQLYKPKKFKVYSLNYSARSHCKGSEIMFFGDMLKPVAIA